MKKTAHSQKLHRRPLGIVWPGLMVWLMTLVPILRGDVPPPHISQFQAGPDGSVLLRWDATPESAYRVLTSTNLGEGVWTPLDYIVATSNSVTWQAIGQAGAARFYRLATDGLAIQSVEPAISTTGTTVLLYVIGQGFGSNDVLRLLGPGGPLTLTNRNIIKPTLMQAVVGPGFTPDVPGTYDVEVTSGSTGQKATLHYAWTVVSGPTASQALVGPPIEPPASPSSNPGNKLTAGVNKRAYGAGKYGIELDGRKAGGDDCDDHDPAISSPGGSNRAIGDDCDDNDPVIALSRGQVKQSRSNVSNNRTIRENDADCGGPYVVAATGELRSQELDLIIPGRGLDFILARTYRSSSAAGVGMAPGWTLSYDVSVVQTAEGLAVADGTGRSDVYFPGTNGVYSRNELFNEGRLSNNVFTLTFPDTGRWEFNPLDASSPSGGKLARSVDRNGNFMLFTYDVAGRLATVVDDLGRTNTLDYNAGGFLASVTDFSGRVVRYEYDVNGDLSACVSPVVTGTPTGNDFPGGKTNHYTYTKGFADDRLNHNLASCTDGKGQTWLQVFYQGTNNPASLDFDAVDFVKRGSDREYLRRYPQTPSPANDYVTVKAIVCDGVGNVTESYWNARGNCRRFYELTGRSNPGQAVTETSNRPAGKLRLDDPDFYETQWSWNNDSLCVQEILPGGNSVACVYELDFDKSAGPRKKGDLRVYRELPAGDDPDRDLWPELTTRLDYHPAFGSPALACRKEGPWKAVRGGGIKLLAATAETSDKPKKIRDWLKDAYDSKRAASAEFRRDIRQVREFREQARRVKVRFYWDRSGPDGDAFVTSATDPRGNVTVASYDAKGNPTQTVRITVSPCGANAPTVDRVFNGYGQVIAITNAPDGNCHRAVDTFSYYTNGPEAGYLAQSVADVSGLALVTAYEYDARGNRTRCIDPRTNDWLYTWNALNQLVQSSTPPLGGSAGSVRVATRYLYDAADNFTECDVENRDYTGTLGTNPFWRTQFVYDALNRPSGCWRDKNGNLVLRCTEVKYDANDNVVLYRSGEAVNGNNTNKVVQFQYDERDLLFLSIAGAAGGAATTNQWDYTPNGKIKRFHCELYVETMAFDGFDRCVSAQDPMGNVITNRYDANGNIILSAVLGETNDVPGSAGNRVLSQSSYQFDALDRCVTVQRARLSADGLPLGKGFATTAWAWAPNGECLSLTDDNNHTTRFTYDTAGRLASVIDPKTNTVAYTYDPNGNVIAITRTDKSDLGPDQVFITTAQFDNLNRCVSFSDNVGNTTPLAYDSRGNLVRRTDANGTLTGWTYDGLDRCTLSLTDLDGNGVLDFAADAGSACTYDDNDCVLVATDDNTNSTFYAYDALDRCVAVTNADGTTQRLIWSPRSNLISETDANGTVINNTYDLNNRCVRRDIAPGLEVAATTTFESFAYDGCGRIIQASNDVSQLDFAYDSLGELEKAKQDCLMTARTFDGVGNCLTMTYPGGRIVTYTYDALDQVTAVSSGGGGLPPIALAQYAYEGPDRVGRISRTNGINTRITWNGKVSPPNTAGDLGWMQPQGINHQRAGGGTVIDQRIFAYDHKQNKTLRAQITPFVGGQATRTNTWSYGPLDQMKHAINTKGTGTAGITDFDLDAQGNRVAVTNNGGADLYLRETAVPPADFQMDQYTVTPFGSEQHDDNGNLVQVSSSSSQTLYAYDYADRLVAVYDLTSGTPTLAASFTYDALGERISKTTYPTPGVSVAKYYVMGCTHRYEGGSILEERADGPNGAVNHVYCWGTDPGGKHRDAVAKGVSKVASFNGAGAIDYYFHEDDLGNVLALTDASGNVLERFEYDNYGAPTFLTSDGVETSATISARGNPFLFHGMEWDGETGLYVWKEFSPAEEQLKGNPRHRTAYVNPKTGRAITRYCENPVHAERSAGGNPYTFAGDNPWTAQECANVTKGGWIDAEGGCKDVTGMRSTAGNGSAGVFMSRGTTSSKMVVMFNPKEYTISRLGSLGGSSVGSLPAVMAAKGNGTRKGYVGHVTLMK